MNTTDPIPALADRSELEAFVAKLPRRRSWFRYTGLEVESSSFGSPGWLAAIVLGWFYGVVDRLFHKRRGWFFRVTLPRALPFDLWMESRWRKPEEGDGLDRMFLWSAIDRQTVHAALSGDVLEAIEALDAGQRLRVTDEWIRVGPISHQAAPAELARVLDQTAGLARLLSDKAVEPEPEPEGDEAPAEPVAAPAGPFVLVHRCTDPLEAEFVQGVLGKHGIDSQVLGTRMAALLGAAPHIFRLRVRVPASQQADAQALLAQVFADPAQTAGTWIDSREEVLFQKKRAVAFGMCFVLPGGGHFYLLRPLSAAVLGLTILAGGFAGLFLEPFHAGLLLLSFGILLDLIGSQWVYSATKAGRLPGAGGQIAWGLFLAGLALAATVGLLALSGWAQGQGPWWDRYLPFLYW